MQKAAEVRQHVETNVIASELWPTSSLVPFCSSLPAGDNFIELSFCFCFGELGEKFYMKQIFFHILHLSKSPFIGLKISISTSPTIINLAPEKCNPREFLEIRCAEERFVATMINQRLIGFQFEPFFVLRVKLIEINEENLLRFLNLFLSTKRTEKFVYPIKTSNWE